MGSELAKASGDQIVIRGHDLPGDLIGKRSFVEVFYLAVTGRIPAAATSSMIESLLVTLVEHGLTPSAIAARMTLLGSPESLQGAVSAGLLGAGSRFLGSSEDAARMLSAGLGAAGGDISAAAVAIEAKAATAGSMLPGFGHPIHRDEDPRVGALESHQISLALDDTYFRLMRRIEALLEVRKGHLVPINAAGAIGAVICDLALPPEMGRAIALVARSAGLIGHILEEIEEPLAPSIWEQARSADH